MNIEKSDKFLKSYQNILDYIAQRDGLTRSKKFYKSIENKIKSLKFMPYKFRKSYFYDDEKIRDLIFKGYVIPYLIDNDKIIILDIFKWRENDE
jgi:toxin ParE1/3/4